MGSETARDAGASAPAADPQQRADAAGSASSAPDYFQRGRLTIRFGSREVIVDGQARYLTPREFELLQFLVQHPTRAYSRQALLKSVWGRRTAVGRRTVDVHIHRLRRHIERDASRPELILNVRKVGYRMNLDALG